VRGSTSATAEVFLVQSRLVLAGASTCSDRRLALASVSVVPAAMSVQHRTGIRRSAALASARWNSSYSGQNFFARPVVRFIDLATMPFLSAWIFASHSLRSAAARLCLREYRVDRQRKYAAQRTKKGLHQIPRGRLKKRPARSHSQGSEPRATQAEG